MLVHINEDYIVPELQLLERFDRLMVAAEAMDGLAKCHAWRIARQLSESNPAQKG